jgi:hypothetical protein
VKTSTPTPASTTTPSDIKTSAQAGFPVVKEEVEVATSQYFTAGSKTNTNNRYAQIPSSITTCAPFATTNC